MDKKLLELLKKIQHVLWRIPDQKNVGPNGESSYEISRELEMYMKEPKE